ncbi:MAG TPA: hypothetical protein VK980_00400 [Sphingomonas sp.]|nr:hypothetical protein [Sphingomonas sp.]
MQKTGHQRWRWVVPASGFVGAGSSAVVRDLRVGDTRQTIIDVSVILAIFVLIGLVEMLLRGRARLWARIAEVSLGLGIFLSLPWLAGVAMLWLALIWLFVTGAMIALAVLQPEVTT